MSITDEANQIVYCAKGELALLSPTWRLANREQEIATIRKRIFSWAPTWIVKGELGEFMIRRKIFSLVRQYYMISGPFDGAKVSGNLWDLKFVISHHGQVLARAKGKLLTLRDTHSIEVLRDDHQSELIIAIAMVALHMDRRDEDQNRNHAFE